MLTKEDLTLLRVWVEGNQKALEWSVGERVLQICGIRGSKGCFERFLHTQPHPTRRHISNEEVLRALEDATSRFRFYRLEPDEVYFENAKGALDAAKKWLRR